MRACRPSGLDCSSARWRIAAARTRRSLWDSYLRYLVTQGYAVPHEVLERDVTTPIEPDEGVQAVLLTVYAGLVKWD